MGANFKIELVDRTFKADCKPSHYRGFTTLTCKIDMGRWELVQLFDPNEIPAHISNVELMINGVPVARGNVVIHLNPHRRGLDVDLATVEFYEAEWITAEDPSSEAPEDQS